MGSPAVVKKRLTPFNITFYMSAGKLNKMKLKGTGSSQTKEKIAAKAFSLKQVRECLLSYLEEQAQWVSLEKVNLHLEAHQHPPVEKFGRNQKSTHEILKEWGVLTSHRHDGSLKNVRVGFRFEDHQIEKPVPLSPEQAEVEEQLKQDFSSLEARRRNEWLHILALHSTEQNSEGVLFLSSNIEKAITTTFPHLSGGLLM
eukprot:UN26826